MRHYSLCILIILFFFSINIFSNPGIEKEQFNIYDWASSDTPSFTTTDTPPVSRNDSNRFFPNDKEYPFLSYTVKIFIFIIILFAIGVVFKKFYKKNVIVSNISQVVDVLGVRPLAHNKFLYLVQFGSRFILLGISDNQIEKISEIINKEEVDNIKLLLNINSNDDDFEKILKKNYNKHDKVTKFKKQLKDLLHKSNDNLEE
jgi:flagellar biogenesis protein FliO